jgi:hypothetical protein
MLNIAVIIPYTAFTVAQSNTTNDFMVVHAVVLVVVRVSMVNKNEKVVQR